MLMDGSSYIVTGIEAVCYRRGHDGVTTSLVSLKHWLRITEGYCHVHECDYRWVFD
jgi:hypothetical protein